MDRHIEDILPKGPYLPCVSMAGGALWQDAIDIESKPLVLSTERRKEKNQLQSPKRSCWL